MYQHYILHNQHQLLYGTTPPRVPIAAPGNDDFLPPSVTEREKMLLI